MSKLFQVKINNSVFEIGEDYIKKDGIKIHKESLLDFVKSPFFEDQSLRAFSGKVGKVEVNKICINYKIPKIRWSLNYKEFTIAELYFLSDICKEKEIYNITELHYGYSTTCMLIYEDFYIIERSKKFIKYGNFKIRDVLSAKINKENFAEKVNKSIEGENIYDSEKIGLSKSGRTNEIKANSMNGKVIIHLKSDHIEMKMDYTNYLNLLDEMKKHLKKTFMEMSRRASSK